MHIPISPTRETDPPAFTLLEGRAEASAEMSPCGTYRYELHRRWDDRPLATWIMLNPSQADATSDDPTIRRCIAYAKSWGYGGILVHNLYALRATKPAELRTHPDPIGPDNHLYLAPRSDAPLTVAAWGAHADGERVAALRVDFAEHNVRLHHLGLTHSGQPRHPLYLPRDLVPTPWPPPDNRTPGYQEHRS